jgi:hypothetical protein
LDVPRMSISRPSANTETLLQVRAASLHLVDWHPR